jgi:uncharacterized membrane protein
MPDQSVGRRHSGRNAPAAPGLEDAATLRSLACADARPTLRAMRNVFSPRIVKKVGEQARGLWLFPSLVALVGVALGIVLPLVDRLEGVFSALRLTWLRPVLEATPDGAQQLLATSAGALATVLGVAFSLTLVTLQLASAHYTTRLLSRLMDDRVTKFVLGSYLGTVAYLLLVVRVVRGADVADSADVPWLSITVGILLVLFCLGLLAYFLQHLGRSIQASAVVAGVGKRTLRRIAELAPDEGQAGHEEPPEAPPVVVRATHPGYVQLVDVERLSEAAPSGSTVVRIDVAVGDFVLSGAPLASIWPGRPLSDEDQRALRESFAVGSGRTEDQDILLGVQQLSDVALKALSPSVNDPTTAVLAVNQLGAIAAALAASPHAPGEPRALERNGVRVLAPRVGLAPMLEEGFRAVIPAAAPHPRVLGRIVELLREVTAHAATPKAREALAEATRWAAIAARHVTGDGRALMAPRLARLRTARDGDEQRPGPLPLH